MVSSGKELESQLVNAGKNLLHPPSSSDHLLSLLDHADDCLSRVEQSPVQSMRDALSTLQKALVAKELLNHSEIDVQMLVASCISEITRISAPEAPYEDDVMKEAFQLIVSSFGNLSAMSSRSFVKRVSILETVAMVRSCVAMLDLDCDSLIIEMFRHFLGEIRDYHEENVFASMEKVMTLVIDESEDISPELLCPVLDSVRKDKKSFPMAKKLGEKVLKNCAKKLKPYLRETLKLLGAKSDDYSAIVASICSGTNGVVEESTAHTEHEKEEDEFPSADLDENKTEDKEELLGEVDAAKEFGMNDDNSSEEKTLTAEDSVKDADAASDSAASKSNQFKKKINEKPGKRKGMSGRIDAEQEAAKLPKEGNHALQSPKNSDKKEIVHPVKGLGKGKPYPVETPKSSFKRASGEEQGNGPQKDGAALVGSKIKVWWPVDKSFYKGRVVDFDAVTKKHRILYFDGDAEVLSLRKERWEIITGDSGDENEAKKHESSHASPERFKIMSSSGATSNNSKARRDPGWKYNFLRDPSNHSEVICKFCSFISNGGIFRAKQHQIGNSRNVKGCTDCPPEIPLAMIWKKIYHQLLIQDHKRRDCAKTKVQWMHF